ncbi:MAG: GNAT family N-acetyltransferase, partial [Muribaculaceae bacterium]|nr:GNAT family N-acetyltransferase [Muribaculaceae bacterium]
CDALDMLELWDAMTELLRREGFRRIVYKTMPHIYHRRPAEEDRYAIFRSGGRLTRSLVSSVIDLDDPIPFDQGSRQRARKAAALPGISIGPSEDYQGFWDVLSRLLDSRYGAGPVHSLAEIELLHGRFPDNIRLYTAVLDGELLAGVVIYVSPTALHSQYTAASPRGKELSVVPAIYSRIIDDYKGRVRWFDFGTSNEDDGRSVNPGLLRQKCSYGARAVVYDTFTIDL